VAIVLTCCLASLAVGQPLLISGTSGGVAKVWDYQSVACVATLDGHGSPLTSVKFHPELPIILTGCGASLRCDVQMLVHDHGPCARSSHMCLPLPLCSELELRLGLPLIHRHHASASHLQ